MIELISIILISIFMLLMVLFGIGIIAYNYKLQEERVKKYEREKGNN